MKDRILWIHIIFLAVSIAMFVVFTLMWIWDSVKVCEPNIPVRLLETLMFAGFAGFSIWSLVKWIREHWED